MSRISFVEKEWAHPIVKELYQKLESQRGQIGNLFKVMGHCPYIGLNFQRLGNSILRGEELPAKLRELAILHVGNLARANYEFAKHTRRALQAGVSQKQIDNLSYWANSKEFNDQERAVLHYTDEVSLNIEVKDNTFAQLKSYLSEHAIVELTTTIGYYGMVCRILVALQIELEPEWGNLGGN